MKEKLPLTTAVLAGGRSMRMGMDKTLLPIEGEALLARVIKSVGEVCASTLVVTNRPEGLDELPLPEGVRVLSDEVPYQGPLGGLVTALAASEDEWVLAVAADMPFVSTEVVRMLWRAREGFDVVVPVTEKGPEPLLALYSKECLQAARGVLESGRRRLVAMFRDVRVKEIPVNALREKDPDLRSFVNVNTMAEFNAAREDARGLRQGPRAPARAGGEEGEPCPVGKPPKVLGLEHGWREGARLGERPLRVIVAGRDGPLGMPVERPVTLHLNDREIATLQATPQDLGDMAAGFFFAEGILTDRDRLVSIDVDEKRGAVFVSTEEPFFEDEVLRSRLFTSGCGKGLTFSSLEHARGLSPIEAGCHLDAQAIHELMAEMARSARAYRETGGMHACGLAHEPKLRLVREDIGRHNAVDKVLGSAWLHRLPLDRMAILTTGRISYEMAVKAARAGLGLLVSRTAVTDQAAAIASKLGVTLVGYARKRRLTVYTHPHRVLNELEGG